MFAEKHTMLRETDEQIKRRLSTYRHVVVYHIAVQLVSTCLLKRQHVVLSIAAVV